MGKELLYSEKRNNITRVETYKNSQYQPPREPCQWLGVKELVIVWLSCVLECKKVHHVHHKRMIWIAIASQLRTLLLTCPSNNVILVSELR